MYTGALVLYRRS